MPATVFIRARALAERWGMEPKTKSGTYSNHTQFLQRLQDKHDNFPKAHRLGGRVVFKREEVEAFERTLPKHTRAA